VQATDKRAARRRKAEVDSRGEKAAVHSLAAARVRRATKRRSEAKQAEQTPPSELTGLDLRGIDFERMTPQASQHFWFHMNRDARRMFASAAEISRGECGQTFGPITADHIQESERRHRARRQSDRATFGLGFALDALQILGASLCGALATKPELLGDAGPFPLAIALTATVTIFLAREILTQRTA
jgi:hypothetical protein